MVRRICGCNVSAKRPHHDAALQIQGPPSSGTARVRSQSEDLDPKDIIANTPDSDRQGSVLETA